MHFKTILYIPKYVHIYLYLHGHNCACVQRDLRERFCFLAGSFVKSGGGYHPAQDLSDIIHDSVCDCSVQCSDCRFCL